MIRVPVPIDLRMVSATTCTAFALVTPLRVDELLRLAVDEALGARAPEDKRERGLAATLDGLRAGKFVVDVDGRIYDRPECVVACAGTVTLRFFTNEPRRRRVGAT